MSARFRYLGPHGREIEINSTDELVRAFKSGALPRDTLLYDAYGGGWAPARSHSALLHVQPAPSVAPTGRRPQAPARSSGPLITPPPTGPLITPPPKPKGEPGASATPRKADGVTSFTLAEPTREATADVIAQLNREREPTPGFGPGLQAKPAEPTREAPRASYPAPGASTSPQRMPRWAAELDARLAQSDASPSAFQSSGVVAEPAVDGIPGWLVPVRVVRSKLGPYGTVAAATVLFVIALALGKSSLLGSPPETTPAPAPTRVPSSSASELTRIEDDAFEDMILEMERRRKDFSVERAPSAWLEGIYLADAGRFPDVREFWARYATYVDSVRSWDEEIFRERMLTRLHGQRLSDSEVSMRLARALRTFHADRERRADVFDGLLELSLAAIDLHAFLLEHQDEIAYEPANAGVSREPVTEAVPATRELAEQMNQRLDRLFVALEGANGTRVAPRDELPLALRRGLTSNNRPSMR